MKIYGNDPDTIFTKHTQEPGIFFGHNDVLAADKQTFTRTIESPFGTTKTVINTHPKLYLHISNSFWTSLTGILREYCLPWRWKAAYLEKENGMPSQRVLVCTSVYQGELPNELKKVIGQSFFAISLIKKGLYENIFTREYLRVVGTNHPTTRVNHPLGGFVGTYTALNSPFQLCHIHRIRGLFSLLEYSLLKNFSSNWEEVSLQEGPFSENVLIKKNDRVTIAQTGLLTSSPS